MQLVRNATTCQPGNKCRPEQSGCRQRAHMELTPLLPLFTDRLAVRQICGGPPQYPYTHDLHGICMLLMMLVEWFAAATTFNSKGLFYLISHDCIAVNRAFMRPRGCCNEQEKNPQRRTRKNVIGKHRGGRIQNAIKRLVKG